MSEKTDRALVTYIYPKVEEVLNTPRGRKELSGIISRYMNANAEKLSSFGPTEQILFPEKMKNELYRLFGFNEKELLSIKKKSSVILEGHTMSYGVNLLMPEVIRFYTIKNDVPMVEACVYFHAMFIYPLLFTKYFPFPPILNVMSYTINSLSNKFKIKQEGTIGATIAQTAIGAYQLHKPGIKDGHDEDAMQYVLAVRTRMNSLFKKIKNEYEINKSRGNYLNLEVESNEDDNYREAEATIYDISNKASKITNNMIIKEPNIKLITLSAKMNQVSVNDTKTYIYAILQRGNLDKIKTVVENIISLYVDGGKNAIDDINTSKFLMFALEMYKRSNTNDKEIHYIKNTLDEWMDTTEAVKKSNRVATLNSFRRAIYTYFVLSIQAGNI